MSEGEQEVIYLDVDGLRRRYVLYRPHRVVLSGEQTPMIIMLDGRGGTAWTAMRTTRWNDKADREGFIVVYPEATRIDPEGPLHYLDNPQMWNAGSGGSDVDRPAIDDLRFLRAVVADVQTRARILHGCCYMAGFSNGAAMAYRYALTYPETVAAIAPVAGHLRSHDLMMREPVPLISLYGRLDPLSPYEGGEVKLPWGKEERRPAAIESIHAWAGLCGHNPAAGEIVSEPGLSRLRYGRRGARDEIEFITIDGLGHVWPGGHRLIPESIVGASSQRICANDEIYAFFMRHRSG